jgi:hypothetical protein
LQALSVYMLEVQIQGGRWRLIYELRNQLKPEGLSRLRMSADTVVDFRANPNVVALRSAANSNLEPRLAEAGPKR